MSHTATSNAATLRLTFGLMLIGTVGAAAVASGLDPITIVFWRSVIGTVFLLVWGFATGILPDRSLTARNLALGAVAGVSLVLSWAAFLGGIFMTSISTATILFHVQPFLVLLIGAAIWREPVTRDQVLWLGIAFVGVVLASGLSLSAQQIDHRWLLGVGLSLGGAAVYAITAIAGKGLADQRGEITTLCQTIVGILVFAPFVDFSQHIALPSWGWLTVIGVVQTGVAWVLIYSAYPRVSTALIAVLSFVNPLTAIATDWMFFGHSLTLAQAMGMVLIVASTLAVKFSWKVLPGTSPLRITAHTTPPVQAEAHRNDLPS